MFPENYEMISLRDFLLIIYVFIYLRWLFQILVNLCVLIDRLQARLILSFPNFIMHTGLKSGIIKTSCLINFTISFCHKYINEKEDAKNRFIYKRRFSGSTSPIGLQELRSVLQKKAEIIRKISKTSNYIDIIVPLLNKENIKYSKTYLNQ